MGLEDLIMHHEHYVMHELLILQILLHEVGGHGDVRVPMDEVMIFVLQRNYIVVIVLYSLVMEKCVMIVMLYHEMVVMQGVLLLSLDILVLHHEMLVKISMNVHLLQTIAIPMQHVPILHEVFLVLVFLDLQETVPYDIVMQYVEMVL